MKNMIHTCESREVLKKLSQTISDTFLSFEVPIEIIDVTEGLRFYHFKIKTREPVRMRAIKAFEDDLRYALGISTLEIEAPLKDEPFVGITIVKKQEPLSLDWNAVVQEPEFTENDDLVIPLGKTEFNESMYIDVRRMPHLLIGGATGSGKSTLLHSIINSLITKHTPDRLRLILVDIKRVELPLYIGLPHLLTPTITDVKKVMIALKWCVKEMERRIDILMEFKVQNISYYHEKVVGNKKYAKQDIETMPYIVVVIDELADLMAAYPKEFEACILRLLQKCRIVGIHLIISTQRPSVKVITGLMKVNISSRIALQVTSYTDSRTILDQSGAETLLGSGDMLMLSDGSPWPTRLQGYFISDEQITKNVQKICKLDATDAVSEESESIQTPAINVFKEDDEDEDDLYEEAKACAIEEGKISTSFLQRKLRIGYGRSAHLIDMLEKRGIIGPADGSKPREVILPE
ncbi:DNA translocase FtsK [Candidatus Kaiserbacteria bacterium]|nr:MAG: DNA translocase FtsK [Candidatus Kaiserbacteria bacterium]